MILLSLLILAVTGLTQEKGLPPALSALVMTERAFARLSVEKGVREAFLTFFADDGINFQPHPVKTKEALRQQPAPATRPRVVLNWAPIYGDVSQAGDLGYTTGPYTLADHGPEQRPTQHGLFFSVWKKQADGSWRVVLDVGVRTPAAVTSLEAPFRAAPRARVKLAGVNLEEERAHLLELDRELVVAAGADSLAQAFLNFLSHQARLHRNGLMPLVGRAAIRGWLTKQTGRLSGEPLQAEVARSADLGYTYGRYELKGAGAQVEKGYYARVREARGARRMEGGA
jgi:ketosteroid isomerase-like protein